MKQNKQKNTIYIVYFSMFSCVFHSLFKYNTVLTYIQYTESHVLIIIHIQDIVYNAKH